MVTMAYLKVRQTNLGALAASWLLNCCQQRWHEQDALE